MDKKTDHDLLLTIAEKVSNLEKGFNNHLKHHLLYTLLALSTALSAIGALALALLHKSI